MSLRGKIRNWLNSEQPDYTAGKNVLSKQNALYVASLRTFINEGRTVEFPVRGWSMRIFVEHERDKAILQACKPEELKRGDVVLAEVAQEHYVLHRIIKVDGDHLTLMGDGNLRGTEECERKDVVALVIGFIRKGKTTPDYVTSRKWRWYSKMWVPLLPIRRPLILGWRLLNRLRLLGPDGRGTGTYR